MHPQEAAPPQPNSVSLCFSVADPSSPQHLLRPLLVSLVPTYNAAFDWGNRRWQDNEHHDDPLDVLAMLAAEEVDASNANTNANADAGSNRKAGLEKEGSVAAGQGKRGRAEVQGEGEGSDEEGASRKRVKVGSEGQVGEAGVSAGPVLNPEHPRHLQVAVAEAYLQRLASENYDVFSAAVKNLVRNRKATQKRSSGSLEDAGPAAVAAGASAVEVPASKVRKAGSQYFHSCAACCCAVSGSLRLAGSAL